MSILFRKIKSLNPKKTLAVVILAGFVAFLMSSPFASANGPQFNIFSISFSGGLNRDLPLLDCRSVTRGDDWSNSQAQHDDGVPSNPGDVVECSIYYHNGAADADENTAHNTVVSASISPSLGSQAFSHTVSASVGASNAGAVGSGDHGGDVRINIPNNENLSLSLIPGSTILFRNQGSNPTTESLPDSIFSGGVNIGDVRGCFEFHGFVNFKLRVSERAAVGDLRVQKHVKNITQGIPFHDDQVSANPGDTVEYQILVSSITNPVQEVRVRDSIDSRLEPFGQVTVNGAQDLDFSLFVSSGAMLGSVAPGETKDIRFQARVSPNESNFPVNQDVRLENTAVAFTNEKSAQDRADVVVRRQGQQELTSCAFTWSSPTASDGRGLRQVGQAANVREQVAGLQPFQSFTIVNRSLSGGQTFPSTVQANSQGNYDIFDTTIIPSSFPGGDYETFIEVNGQRAADCVSFKIETPAPQVACVFTWNDPTTADRRGIRQVGQAANVREQVSNLAPFQSFAIVDRHLGTGLRFPSTVQANSQGNYDIFDTTIIPSSFPAGDYETFIEVGGQNVANCKSFRIEAQQIQQIRIDKQIKNENTGVGFADSVDAAPSQRLAFRIVIDAGTSNVDIQNVVIRDLLPDKLVYVSGSLNVDGHSGSDAAFFGSGLGIGTISPGGSKTIIFSADVKSQTNFSTGCESQVNTATVTASGGLSATDSATARVCKDAPTKAPGSPANRPLDS